MPTITRQVVLAVEDCIVCGVTHALPQATRDYYQKHGGYWVCPNGHSQGWDKKNCQTETDKLRNQVARLESQVTYKQEQIDTERRRTAAAKEEVTKIQKRVANGVCPCCHRTFVNVARHMASKHPDFAEETTQETQQK